jgi:hypothetical protein
MTKLQFAYHLSMDFERWPLPICFDAYAEQVALNMRMYRIQTFTDRFFSFWKITTYNGKALKID